MSFRAQYTPFTTRDSDFARVFSIGALKNELSRDLADEAENIIRALATYPGEVEAGGNLRNYFRTGRLRLRNYNLLTTNRRGQVYIANRNDPSGLFKGGYERTGQLGLAWSYEIKDSAAGGITLVFTNVAHDRPGNYYAGWVNGLISPNSRSKYHQTEWHADHGWKSFPEALEEKQGELKAALQDTINDYFKRMGVML